MQQRPERTAPLTTSQQSVLDAMRDAQRLVGTVGAEYCETWLGAGPYRTRGYAYAIGDIASWLLSLPDPLPRRDWAPQWGLRLPWADFATRGGPTTTRLPFDKLVSWGSFSDRHARGLVVYHPSSGVDPLVSVVEDLDPTYLGAYFRVSPPSADAPHRVIATFWGTLYGASSRSAVVAMSSAGL